MRSARPKPLHLLCGRPMLLLRPRRAGRAAASSGSSSSSATAPSGSPRSSRTTAADLAARVRRAARPAGHRRRRQRRPHRLPRRRLDDDDGDVLVLPGDTPLLRADDDRRARRPRTAQPTPRAPCSPPVLDDPTGYGRVVRGKDDRVRPHRRAGRRHRRRARDRRDQHVDLLLPPQPARARAAPAQPRERPGRVLPDRRRRGAPRRRLPGRRAWWPTTRPRPHGVNDRVQLAAAEAELRRRTNDALAAARASRWSTPTAPTSTPPSQLAPDVTLFPGTILQGRTVVGERRRDRARHPARRLHGRRRRRRRADRRPRRRDRRRRHGRARSPCSSPGARCPPGAVTGPFYTAADRRRADERPSGAGD